MQQQPQGVQVYFGKSPLFFGECILHKFQKDRKLIGFTYDKSNGRFELNDIQEHIAIDHSVCCPLIEQSFEPNDLNKKQISLAVCGIVCDSEKNYLLTRRNEKMRTFSKAWVFPGGMVDTGEDLEQALLREIKEEVGISKEEIEKYTPIFLCESVFPTHSATYPIKQSLIVYYAINLLKTKEDVVLKISEAEVDKIEWIKEEDVQEILLNKSEKYQELNGIYPNEVGSGIGEGSRIALQYLFK